ncbi:MAG: amino acid permease, partial [Phycisphaera sp.]|nr:amino acid permease [Phycisphaera sp.]
MTGSDPQRNEAANVPSPDEQRRVIGLGSATGICVASMIGMGIFTVTGVVGADLGSTSNLMLVWIIAGVVALAGAMTIGELGAMRPKASAQYVIVHESLGPTCGYLNGMITLFIGYIAAIAAIAIVAGEYIENLAPWTDARITATVLLLGLGVIHAITVIGGKRFNDGLVILKVLVIVGFIVAGLTMAVDPIVPDAALIEAARTAMPGSPLATIPADASGPEILEHLRNAPSPPVFSAAIGLAVITISFAYLGWSTAAEVAGEIRNPG